jgi:hypothetical protein
MAWMFGRSQTGLRPTFERTDDDIRTNIIPALVSVSSSSSRINIGSIRDGEAPFGITGSVSVQIQDIEWDDRVGDFYLADRAAPYSSTFWRGFLARNRFFGNMLLRVYEGFVGDDLGDMEQRLYVVENIDGPDSSNMITIEGVDPLRLTDESRALFPRETIMALGGAIDSSQTSGIVIEASIEADLSDDFGNTSPNQFLIIGSEIIRYTGYTGSAGVWTLTGVIRGQLGTTAASHADEDAAQRVGRYGTFGAWAIANDLLENHSPVDAVYIDYTQWTAEAALYLQGYNFTRTVTRPTPVNQLVGELMRDGTFYIWWDERAQKIKLKAVRPEASQINWDDNSTFIADSVILEREPDEQVSRIFIYYDVINPTAGDDPTNYRYMLGRISADVENENGGGFVRSKTIYSRWIATGAQAIEATTRLLSRFQEGSRYLRVQLVDGTIEVGDVVNVTTDKNVNSEGVPLTLRWQVISKEVLLPREQFEYLLQEFIYQQGRFSVYAADDSDDYDEYTEEELEDGTRAFYTDEDGLMADGKQGYLYQ